VTKQHSISPFNKEYDRFELPYSTRTTMSIILKTIALFTIGATLATGFVPSKIVSSRTSPLAMADEEDICKDGKQQYDFTPGRRSFLASVGVAGSLLSIDSAFADDGVEEESFSSIAARASKLSSSIGEMAPPVVTKPADGKSIYDFSLPVKGESVNFKDIVEQEFDEEGRAKVKAILVVNMKEDDPISRTDIPEFMSLAAKYVPQQNIS
jgi:hypothetical protein